MMRATLGVLLLVASSACTIVVREGSTGAGAPPPPPPPRAPKHQPAQAHAHPRPAPAKPAAKATGTLEVSVLKGRCELRVDGRSRGTRSSLAIALPTGSHVVTCQPVGGSLQAHTAVVHAQAVTNVVFDLGPKAARPVPKAPVGRPTPAG